MEGTHQVLKVHKKETLLIFCLKSPVGPGWKEAVEEVALLAVDLVHEAVDGAGGGGGGGGRDAAPAAGEAVGAIGPLLLLLLLLLLPVAAAAVVPQLASAVLWQKPD